jgi:hypothetical protein
MTNQVEFERYFRAASVGRWDTLDSVAGRQVGAAVDNELRGLTNQLLNNVVPPVEQVAQTK